MGCSNCGLSFCNKCLKQKCKLPNKGNTDHPVCRTCYQNLTSTDANSTAEPNIPPPDVFLKCVCFTVVKRFKEVPPFI